jgi:DNA-binding GntR family transcriptional regulator
MVITRSRRLSMLISDEEHDMLQALAEREGVTASDYVRLHIRRTHAELAASVPSKSTKAKAPKRRK